MGVFCAGGVQGDRQTPATFGTPQLVLLPVLRHLQGEDLQALPVLGQPAQKSLGEHHSGSAHVVTYGLSLLQGTHTEGRRGCGAAPQSLTWMADVHLPIAVLADARM